MRSTGVHHVDLVVGSVERTLPFYRDLLGPLGYHRISEVEGERGETIWYFIGPGSGIGLREAQSEGAYDRYRVGLHHLAFEAVARSVVDERYDWLVETGAEIESRRRNTLTCSGTTQSSSTTPTASSSRSSTSRATPPRPARARSGASRRLRPPGRASGSSRVKQARQTASSGQRRRRLHALEREVGERGRADVLAHLLDRAVRGDQLVLVGHVDAVEARRDDRRRRDAHVHLGRARVEQHLHDLRASCCRARSSRRRRRAACPATSASGLNFSRIPCSAQLLVGLDERPPDVAVLDQPLARTGCPSARAKPIAAGVPESGIGITRSASTGASAASRSPMRTRAPCTSTPPSRESGRAK